MPKVMIVEDDFMIADSLEETLIAAGYEVCGIAKGVGEAIALGRRHRPDLAVIDLRLSQGGYGTEVAAALGPTDGLGILYASGNPDHPLLQRAIGEACISKPYTATAVVAALQVVSERMARRSTLTAFPDGFRLLHA
ncbi:response regulator [Paeniroseomonas aquatica]|uniref:Response regulator n=1 Tax=Paeniroseomonas aquatica TaxID=373043 RepID=A0ABT8A5I3_9PROT|nr:response regulator [Paeniroseomonas aquatica]MDN3565043.1 response regulator [Paeniroseomonas aquatica]